MGIQLRYRVQLHKEDEYCNEIEVQVLHGHIVSLANGRHSDAGSVKPIYDFFFSRIRTISDIGHIFEHRVPDLIALDSLPSRDIIIKDIVANAKPADRLASWVRTVLTEMIEEEPECDICMLSFAMPNEAPDETDGQGNELPWLSVSQDRRGLLVRKGYERVPMVTGCEHYFCGGCMSAMVAKAGARECPYRDKTYGVHRAKALHDVKMIGERYRFNGASPDRRPAGAVYGCGCYFQANHNLGCGWAGTRLENMIMT
jgi:hypothetical protein